MKPNLKTLASLAIAILFIAPLILSTVPVQAQFAIIRSVPPVAYPGEPVNITIDVNMATTVYVYLCADIACTTVWASTWFVPPSPGTYTVSLTLPESLPGPVNIHPSMMRSLFVGIKAPSILDVKEVPIAPKVVVSPPQTANVDPFNKSQLVTIRFLGYIPGDTISLTVFEGPITTYNDTSIYVGDDGTATTRANLTMLTGGYGLPRGTYTVYGVAGETSISKAKNGTLTIVPQVVIKPTEGNGRCDARVCDLINITITGYGFDPNVSILKIDLWNLNFTNVRYTFTKSGGLTTTNEYGFFNVSNLAEVLRTNMSAGLYIPIVYEAPTPKTLSNSSTIDLGKTGTVVISQSAIYNALGTRASVTAKSFVNGTFKYVVASSAMSYTKTEVLRVNITYAGKKYMLAANIEGNVVRFTLYNTTVTPPITMFTDTTTTLYNNYYGAYTANVSFNIKTPPYLIGTDYNLTAPSTPGEYTFWATFYNYTNYIYLELKQWSFVVTAANLTITYSNVDTGTTIKKFYVYPANMSVTKDVVSIETIKFSDADISWSISWRYNATERKAYLSVTGQPTKGPSFTFRNVYYIVRPLLVLLKSGIIKPGDTVTIAAYGYGPGAAWGYPGYNTLYVYWEKIRLLTTVPLGKDGNATFTVTIPSDATFGVHYIWGVDKWGYEYSLAIVIGAKAYWTIVYPPPFAPPAKVEPKVSAGYDNKRIVVCPCPESAGVTGVSYCAKCVTYAAACDYLGDIIRVTLAGLSPGETVEVRFGGITVKKVKANESVVSIEFVVPTVPQGSYTLVAVGSVSGTIYVNTFYNTTAFLGNETNPVYPQVVPKLLLLDLNKDVVPILVGQGIVRVIGTGFPPGASVLAMLINGTDAGYSLNLQVQRWSSDSRGVLSSPFTEKLGLYIPVLEPGAYAISLAYVMPDKGTPSSTMPGYVFVVNNVSKLVDKDYFSKEVATLSSQISDVSKSIKAVNSSLMASLSAIASSLDKVSTALDGLSKLITSVNASLTNAITTSAAGLSDSLGKVSSKVDAVSSKVDTLTATVNTINTKIDSVSAAVKDVGSAVAGLPEKIDTLSGKIDAISSKADTIANTVKTLGDLSSKLDSAIASLTGLSSKVDALSGKVDSVASSVADVSKKVDNVASAVNSVSGKVDAVSSSVGNVASKVDSVASKLDSASSTLQTYIIITLVLALIAAATSIYAAIQLGRKLAA
ncbi:methyl-accepting chemotaxis protein [Ignisphaera sp. 4213-co]|uniref:Methyl-accepting chemotaxis protein n=1 Tax=Ignisphaera cupida TaxID=3050454 RepID=A0ABD4Z4D8_9CREN|nr:methyl-accepting chemotaxis protein [Ignisphaera sp. 4213-co]MDK6027827.1 methyl-accepting chemotaxis protein [Ignisphaera sp. 4213-co]